MDTSPTLLDGISPIALADLMLMVPLRRRANLVVLQPEDQRYLLHVKRGSLSLGTFDLSAQLGNATVARLARMANVEPLAASGEPSGENTGRFRARAGAEHGEFLLSVGGGTLGLQAELRPLSINGGPLEAPAKGQLRRCLRCAAFQPPQRQTCEIDGGDLIDIDDDPRPGGTIGVYRTRGRLGDGGMGTVLEAEHALIGRRVAIKLPHVTFADNPVVARRFLSEARAASRLHHPNIIDVTDFGVMSDGRPYMVMERLEGTSLGAYLDAAAAPLPATEALLIAREIAYALDAAHEGGVTHRDLKPDNVIMLETSRKDAPRLKLLDFGAAGLRDEVDPSDILFGTPTYMSPEHLRGEATDGRTDLYALGVLLYEMLAGKVPFDGNSPSEVLVGHLVKPVPAPQDLAEPIPEVIMRIVMRALRKKAAERYQSAAEMLLDIEAAIAGSAGRRDWRRFLPGGGPHSTAPVQLQKEGVR